MGAQCKVFLNFQGECDEEVYDIAVGFDLCLKYSPLSRPKKLFYKVARCASVFNSFTVNIAG